MSEVIRRICYTQGTLTEETPCGIKDTNDFFVLICCDWYEPIIIPEEIQELGRKQCLLRYSEKPKRDIVERDYRREMSTRGIS
ncbi:hypothetical protein M0Q03_01020 [bacterium]|jgi:hypothetical protein|nr:hypothetical protein [bacterium]